MLRRPLGKSGLECSVVGFGAWQLGNADWSGPAESEAVSLVHQALDGGCNFFDTAPAYGEGQSETLLGKALQGRRDQALICTKFGHASPDTTDFSVGALRPSLEASLRRLRTDHVDVLVLHNPPDAMMSGQVHAAEMEKLKQEGKLRAWGVSADWAKNVSDFASAGTGQAVEILFNALHQEPAAAFEPAHEKGVGFIAKVPLDSGWLSGKYHADSQFDGVRGRWSAEVKKRRAALVDKLKAMLPEGLDLTTAALRFAFSPRAMSTVIPGVKDAGQLKTNLRAGAEELDPALIDAVRRLWAEEIAGDPLPW